MHFQEIFHGLRQYLAVQQPQHLRYCVTESITATMTITAFLRYPSYLWYQDCEKQNFNITRRNSYIKSSNNYFTTFWHPKHNTNNKSVGLAAFCLFFLTKSCVASSQRKALQPIRNILVNSASWSFLFQQDRGKQKFSIFLILKLT